MPDRKSSAHIYIEDAVMWPAEVREKCLSYLQELVVHPSLIRTGKDTGESEPGDHGEGRTNNL